MVLAALPLFLPGASLRFDRAGGKMMYFVTTEVSDVPMALPRVAKHSSPSGPPTGPAARSLAQGVSGPELSALAAWVPKCSALCWSPLASDEAGRSWSEEQLKDLLTAAPRITAPVCSPRLY